MFAHAGVHLSSAAATDCVEELRSRIRSPAVEYKANHLLREKNRKALEWFLGPGGPIDDHAHVHLVDKTLFLIRQVVQLVGGDVDVPPSDADGWAVVNDFLRPRRGDPVNIGKVLAAFPALHGLRGAGPLPPKGLDPLEPAILRAVAVWGDAGRVPVAVIHDRQTSLTADRVAALMAGPGAPASLRFVGSRTDPRVQIADFLAGVATRAVSEQLAGRGDAALLDLLAPYVDPESVLGADVARGAVGGVG